MLHPTPPPYTHTHITTQQFTTTVKSQLTTERTKEGYSVVDSKHSVNHFYNYIVQLKYTSHTPLGAIVKLATAN